MFGLFFLFVLVPSSTALIYRLNESDYNRMPPLFHLDGFEECFDEPDAMYCFGEFFLVSEEPSELLSMIQEFSEDFRHYNHTLLRYGYCMKKTCNEFYNVSGSDVDLRSSFEACSNKTIYNKYKLKTRLTDELDCSKRDRDLPIDKLDIFVGVVCILIIMANLIGSLCDRYLNKGKERGVLKFLYCFSINRNWKEFVATDSKGRDPRFKTLRGIHGIRAISMCLTVITHLSFTSTTLVVNPEPNEEIYQNSLTTVVMSGPLIMQTFFLVSSFLLVYNWLLDSETHPLSWNMLPRKIIMRWLRLTPSYALIIGLVTTWFTRLASGGPMWAKAIYHEARDCRQTWWTHILYINNYIDRTNCMAHTWYLAADTQLYIVGIFMFLLCRTNLTRKVALSLLFVVGIIVPMLQTYYHNLNGMIIVNLELVLNEFKGDPTFDETYSTGHTNLVGCIIGMAMGYIIYNWQKAGGDPQQFQKYRYLYWSLPTGIILVFSTGCIFYADGASLPMYVHVLYAGLQKPVFGLVIATIIAGVIIQFEGLIRPILEWRIFAYIAQLSYSTYLVHVPFIRTDIASIMSLQRFTLTGNVQKITITLIGVLIAAFFLWLMVEMPFNNITKEVFKKPRTKEQNKEAVKKIEKTEDENGIDVNNTKTEDGTIVIKMGTKI